MWAPVVAVALLCAALASADHKREEREAKAAEGFWVGARYGRSPHAQRTLLASRNDRFFLGSRFGKRAAMERWKRGLCRCAPLRALQPRSVAGPA